jgi:hypothetical protein
MLGNLNVSKPRRRENPVALVGICRGLIPEVQGKVSLPKIKRVDASLTKATELADLGLNS